MGISQTAFPATPRLQMRLLNAWLIGAEANMIPDVAGQPRRILISGDPVWHRRYQALLPTPSSAAPPYDCLRLPSAVYGDFHHDLRQQFRRWMRGIEFVVNCFCRRRYNAQYPRSG